jgi:hypothetical protein
MFRYIDFIYYLFIYHSFKLVKGGFICKLFEDRWGIFFFITSRHFDIWRRSQFSVQYWAFFGTSIFGYIFFFFVIYHNITMTFDFHKKYENCIKNVRYTEMSNVTFFNQKRHLMSSHGRIKSDIACWIVHVQTKEKRRISVILFIFSLSDTVFFIRVNFDT